MTMGGSQARGNPIGAKGVYQAVEAVQQLRGEAGANQVPDARIALTLALGGPASTAIAHVFERSENREQRINERRELSIDGCIHEFSTLSLSILANQT